MGEHASAAQTRALCIMVVLVGHVSFRSVPRVMGLFLNSKEWIPHFTSVINWTLRFGLALLSQVAPIDQAWVAILDHSIDIGVKKVLVVLRVRLDALQKRGSALQLEDCQCIGIQVMERSDGESVAAVLGGIFAVAGSPTAIIKDGGLDLARGVSLWREGSDQKQVKVIDDIGHVVANSLKHQYAKSKLFQAFLTIINGCAKKLRQTRLAFLAPPKLRTKGRFQGVTKLAQWAEKILTVLEENQEDAEYKRLRTSLLGLSQVKGFLRKFAETVITTSKIMQILKNEGLNQKTYQECQKLTQTLPERSVARKKISAWLNKHLSIQCRLGIGQTPLPVSSDIIESLFGKFKAILERGSMLDMNRSVLLLPTLCANHESLTIQTALSITSHKDIEKWDRAHIPYTQNRRRRNFLAGNLAKLIPETGKNQGEVT